MLIIHDPNPFMLCNKKKRKLELVPCDQILYSIELIWSFCQANSHYNVESETFISRMSEWKLTFFQYQRKPLHIYVLLEANECQICMKMKFLVSIFHSSPKLGLMKWGIYNFIPYPTVHLNLKAEVKLIQNFCGPSVL